MQVESVLVQLGTILSGNTFTFAGDANQVVYEKTDTPGQAPNSVKVVCLATGVLGDRGNDEGVIETPMKVVRV